MNADLFARPVIERLSFDGWGNIQVICSNGGDYRITRDQLDRLVRGAVIVKADKKRRWSYITEIKIPRL